MNDARTGMPKESRGRRSYRAVSAAGVLPPRAPLAFPSFRSKRYTSLTNTSVNSASIKVATKATKGFMRLARA